MSWRIPIYKPYLAGNEKTYVSQCLDSSWISSRGEFVTRFEESFAAKLGVSGATTVSNGTVALHLALLALGVGEGDEVIVPTLTYIASVNAISYVGAKPVFIDSDPISWNLNSALIEEKITERTKAVMVVHLYGAVCDMGPIKSLCVRHGLRLIEDVAEAFGSRLANDHAGTFGDVATFSFFGNKTITTGEGGMVIARDPSLLSRIAFLKSQAVSFDREYWHDEIGYNYRMTNICAAIGLAQLERADEIIARKREIAEWYREEFAGIDFRFQPETKETFHTYWMVSGVAASEKARDRLRHALAQAGVETRPVFYPVHTMPVFKSGQVFPVAEDLSQRGINLPSYPALQREDINLIGEIVRDAAKQI